MTDFTDFTDVTDVTDFTDFTDVTAAPVFLFSGVGRVLEGGRGLLEDRILTLECETLKITSDTNDSDQQVHST